MNKEQLKPCPFCGSGNVGNGHTAVWWVSCYSCIADGPTADTELEAAEQWNHAPRASDVAAIQSTANLLETVFAETAQELGCKQDNEAVLEAIAALRARAVPEVVWQDLTPELGGRAESTVKSGEFTLVIYRWEDERAYSIRVDGTAIRGSIPEVVSLADCKAACEAAFLRLVGAGS